MKNNVFLTENRIIALLFLIIIFFNILIFNRYFPIMEGWWETFAYLKNQGLVIGKDFYLPWTPLFVYINDFYENIFGTNFFIFRLIGIFIFPLQAYVFYKLLCEFFPKLNSAISVLFANFLFIAEPHFIAKDYHSYFLLFQFLSLFFFVKSIKIVDKTRSFLYFFFAVFFLTLLFLLKQNVGIVLYGSLFLTFAFIFNKKDYFIKISFLILLFLLFLYIFYNSITIDFSVISSSNDSKGSIFSILTKFLSGSHIKILFYAIFFCILLIYLQYFLLRYEYTILLSMKSKVQYFLPKPYINLTITLFLLFLMVIVYINKNFIIQSHYVIMPFSIGIILYVFVKKILINKSIQKEYIFIILSITALTYCNTHTANFDYYGSMLCIGFAFSYLLSLNLSYFIRYIFIAFMVIVVIIIFFERIKSPYTWWSYSGSIFDANATIKFKQLDGLYVDSDTSNVYNYLYDYVAKNSKTKKDFYFFNFPVMYLLNEKLPPYKMVTQWFDVSPSKMLNQEFESFVNNPIDNIVMVQYPTKAFVDNEHFYMKHDSIQRKFYLGISKRVINGQYKFVKSLLLPNSYFSNYDALKTRIKAHVIVYNDIFNEMDIYDFLKYLHDIDDRIVVKTISRNNVPIFDNNTDATTTTTTRLRKGDKVIIVASIDLLFNLIPIIGVEPINNAIFTSVNIYKKIN